MYRYQGECFVYKKIILTAISSLLLFTLGGCSPSAAPKEPRLFGFTAMDMTDQSFRLALAELEELVNQNGDSLITFDPQLDKEKQLQGISDMISQGREVLFLNPVDINGILPALRECQENGVKIICFDSKVSDASYIETFVGGDNYKMGWLIGDYIKKDFPQGGTLAYLTNPQAGSILLREQGLLESLEGSNIEVIDVREISRYEEVLPATEKLLEDNDSIDIIWGFNDDICLMMHSCAVANERQDQITFYATGGNPGILDAVKRGNVRAVSVQSPADWGKVCGELCYKLLDGEEVNSDYLLEASIIDTESVNAYEMDQ